MNDKHIADDTAHWAATLPVLRQLSSELDAGIRALARDDFKEFEKHVATQGELCDLLIQTKLFTVPDTYEPAANRSLAMFPSPVKSVTASFPAAFHRLVSDLAEKNRLYSALLERAKRYTRILLTLYHSRHGYMPDGSPNLYNRTWSSEV
jgi:hypothetical protein